MLEIVKAKYKELEARKRAELEASLEAEQVADPVSILIATAISVAVSAASYAVAYAFAPKAPKQILGKLSGSLQLQNSEQGIFIPEIYGAGPTATIVAGSSPTYQNLTNVTGGAGGALTKTSGANNAYNAGASHNAAVASGDAFLDVTPGSGWASAGFFDTASPTGSGGNATGCVFGVQWGPDGSLWGIVNEAGFTISTWVSGDVFRIELKNGRFALYKNSAQLSDFPVALAIPSYPLYLGVIAYTTGAGVSASKVQLGSIGDSPNQGRGGIKIPAIIVWSSGIRKHVTTTPAPTQGGKGGGGGGGGGTVENITYDIDLGMMFGRGPLNLIREYANADILIDQYTATANPSGVYDSTVGADPDYDPALPPDPRLNYLTSEQRLDADIAFDGDGVGTGTIQGGGSQFAVYPGNAAQQPDPTIEADIDARYGAGSTPAYKNHSLIVHTQFSLSRWSGIVPNITAVWEHQTLKTLDDIFGSMCERVNVKAANSDYDLSGISTLTSRGILIAGRPFAPAEVMDSPEIKLAYNYFPTEVEGQVVAFIEGDEPELEIDDTEIGWLEGDAELPDVAPEVETVIAPEISFPREVIFKSLDPDNEWEPNTQNAIRQITDGQSVEMLEVQIAQLSDERRATAQRALYQKYVAGSVHKFTLPWTYLYVHPGYRIVINRAEGFTHTLRLTSLSGGVGVLDCEAVALEPSVFTQPANGVFPPGYIPPQPIPAMTVLQLLDTPILRDGDVTSNDGVGRYAAGVPRTGVNQSWRGFTLYVRRRVDWEYVASFNLPATIGTVVSATSLSTDPTTIDPTGEIVVDLYGTTATLTSVTEADVLAGANMAVAAGMVFNFQTATQMAGFPNRWSLTDLLNGQRDTEEHIDDAFTGARFVLINEAVKFVPMLQSDVDTELDYRAVSSGQSLGDAATVSDVWDGNTMKPRKVVDVVLTKDASNDWLIQFEGRPRPGEEPESYAVEVWPTTARTDESTIKRILPVTVGSSHAALLRLKAGVFSGGKTDYVHKNNLTGGLGATLESIVRTNTRVDFGIHWSGADGAAAPGASWPTSPTVWLYAAANPFSGVLGGVLGTPLFGISWVNGTNPGTIKEQYWQGSIQVDGNNAIGGETPAPTLILERDNIDPGFGTIRVQDTDPVDAGRRGPRYSFQVAGSEFRVYRNYQSVIAQPPVMVIPAPIGGFDFPLFLVMQTASTYIIRNVIFGAAATLSTIYSKREQVEDFTAAQNTVHFRIYQKAKFTTVTKGLPYDVDETIT